MRRADVVLMCSRSEAFGRVTIEGMLAGKPVIGSRSGATPELIQDGVTGLIYEPRNYKQLAQKIEYLYANPEKTALMGQQAKEWAMATFGQARYGDDLIRLLSEFSEVAPNSHSTESKLG
jgi:glycosyltransferase involved in cell wall biosynthesis